MFIRTKEVRSKKDEVICYVCEKRLKRGKRSLARHLREEHAVCISERDIDIDEDGNYSVQYRNDDMEIDQKRIDKMLKLWKSLSTEEKEALRSLSNELEE